MRISEADRLDSDPEWLTRAVAETVQDLISDGTAVITTLRGMVSLGLSNRGSTVRARARPPLPNHYTASDYGFVFRLNGTFQRRERRLGIWFG